VLQIAPTTKHAFATNYLRAHTKAAAARVATFTLDLCKIDAWRRHRLRRRRCVLQHNFFAHFYFSIVLFAVNWNKEQRARPPAEGQNVIKTKQLCVCASGCATFLYNFSFYTFST